MSDDLRILAVPALADNYVWLLADASGAAIVVDPGEAAPVRAALAREHLELAAVLLTHHHPDHIGATEALIAGRPVPVYAPNDERIAFPAHRVAHGDRVELEFPPLRFDVIGIPGHTRTHIAFHGHGIVFCGDTLFSVGCGRMFEGTPEQMLASLDRLAALPGDTLICCGHEYTVNNCAFAQTVDPENPALARRAAQARALRERGAPTLPVSLHEERACNPFLRVDSDAIVAALPDAPDRVGRFAELRRRKDEFRAPTA
jgi:hydroxyacylglutathione hydrolase